MLVSAVFAPFALKRRDLKHLRTERRRDGASSPCEGDLRARAAGRTPRSHRRDQSSVKPSSRRHEVHAGRTGGRSDGARRSLGTLHGLPMHKDRSDEGIRTAFGSPIFTGLRPAEDSFSWSASAKLARFCQSNTPGSAPAQYDVNPVFGATLNPWDKTRRAAAAAARGAGAGCRRLRRSDGRLAGQSRQFCGVVGLRLSPGCVPVWPAVTRSPLSLYAEGAERRGCS